MSTESGQIFRRVYEGLNNRLPRFAGGRFASFCRPTAIMFLLTERCSARCVHCDIWKNRGKEDSPTADQWRGLVDDLRQWLGPVSIVLTGGEAMLKPYAAELAAYARRQGFWVEVLSHGYWADQRRIEQLALADPSRITISLDGIGAVHSLVRGIPDFFERTSTSIDTLLRVRSERKLNYTLRAKTVIMQQNLDSLADVARFATREGMEVFYQPIEQNYNTPDDPEWFLRSANWPRDPEQAVRKIEELMALKREGLHIANTMRQLEVMIPYFRRPSELMLRVQSHKSAEKRPLCAALNMLQVQANGDVTVCSRKEPVGNFRRTPVRTLWEQRPRWWEGGCCLEAECNMTI